MSLKTTGTEEKILSATISCIEKYGISGATNRRIAEMAGVNLAAINYYFRSKEALIQRVMEITLKNAFGMDAFPPMPGVSAKKRCVAIFTEILLGGLNYPGITRAHFHNLLVEGQPDPPLVERINHFIEDLAADFLARGGRMEGSELKLALVQVFSVVIMAALAPTLFERQKGNNLSDPEQARAYVTRLVDKLMA